MKKPNFRAASGGSAPRSADESGSAFMRHAVWAPGVSLFRRLRFPAKAGLISLAFLIPMLLLGLAYLRASQEKIDFARHEQAGVLLLDVFEPWQVEVQKQRRLVMSGLAEQVDFAAIEALVKPVRSAVEAMPDGLDVREELQALERQYQELVQADSGHGGGQDAALAQSMQRYIDAVHALRVTVLDRSFLILDPDQDSYYLMSLAGGIVPNGIESVSRAQALAGGMQPAAAESASTPPYALHGIWYQGRENVAQILKAADHAAEVNAAVKTRLHAREATEAATAFYERSARSWFGPDFKADVEALSVPGQAAIDALRTLGRESSAMLAELLQQRIDGTLQARRAMLAVIAVSLLVSAYLFCSFALAMGGDLGEVGRHLQAMSSGDLTTTPKPRGRDEAAELMQMLVGMQRGLRNMVQEVRSSSDGIVDASAEIAEASTDLSTRTEQAAANLVQSAASMQEVTDSILKSTDYLGEASRIASHNEQTAGKGGEVIDNLVTTMDAIQESSKKIVDIISVIDSIAFQTNILALNAAVEAARAGEQGRGFAVVAAEVQSLAQRSASAAKEINTLITRSVQTVEGGTDIVRHAGETMRAIVVNAKQLNEQLENIARGAQADQGRVGQVGAAIQELDRTTQQNAAVVEQTASAAGKMSDQAQHLAHQIARFKMPG